MAEFDLKAAPYNHTVFMRDLHHSYAEDNLRALFDDDIRKCIHGSC